jgi:hypothetical protein
MAAVGSARANVAPTRTEPACTMRVAIVTATMTVHAE